MILEKFMLLTMTIAEPAVELLQEFCKVYKKRDLKAMKKMFAKKTFSFGTGRDEILEGWPATEAQLKRDWSQSKAGWLELHKPIKSGSNWASCTWTAHITMLDGKELIWPNMRLSIVVAQEDGKWKIAHTHASAPAVD
jgi:hypothetical protein